MPTIQNKVKGFRNMAGLTQEEMAKALCISLPSYCLKENGVREFTHSEMVAFTNLIKKLNETITMDDIFMV